jgi:KUP system potassium uptake protein
LCGFTTLAIIGLSHIVDAPEIIRSVNPYYAFQYFTHESKSAFLSLGAIFLVVTGGEALYADMGHFGRKPITIGWYGMVLPSLVLNYWGQGAFLLKHPEDIESVFFRMVPEAIVDSHRDTCHVRHDHCLAGFDLRRVLSHCASSTTGLSPSHQDSPHITFTLWTDLCTTRELVVDDCLYWSCHRFPDRKQPRCRVRNRSHNDNGNHHTDLLPSLTDRWNWSSAKAMLLCAPLLVIEAGFLGANLVKIPHGGWFALAVGLILMVQMQTWRRGRALVAQRIHRGERSLVEVLEETEDIKRVTGTAVFMFKDLGKAPPALVNNLRHNKVLHKTTLIVAVETSVAPRVEMSQRATVVKVGPGVCQVQLEFGFMDEPDVPATLAAISFQGLDFDPDDATYFIGHESIIAGKAPGMNPLAEHLFVFLNRGADSASRFFNLPIDRVFEVGSHVEI